MSETSLAVLLALVKCVFSVAFVMQIVPLLIWAERKGAAYIQDRPGPNRAHVLGIRAAGLVHTLPDVFKLITKEDIVPGHVFKPLWALAPVIAMTISLITFAVVPWGDQLTLPAEVAAMLGHEGALSVELVVSNINGGVLYVLAMTSLGVYGIMLAGWASNNKFSLLGGLRSSAQMVSYELAMGLALVAMFMVYGTVQLTEITAIQSANPLLWGVFLAPPVGFISFILFWVSAFAECNRNPFDLPESEAELVAGYHTEYSSLRFALFFMAEYANMIVASAVTATLFFGGYNIPLLNGEVLRGNIDLVVMAIGAGGAVFFAGAAFVAFKRRERRFYKALPAGDMRHREWKVFTGLWAAVALAHLGLIGAGATGLIGGLPLATELVVFVSQLNMLVAKVLVGCWMFIWVRWTLPRFRYDQLMDLGWKYMLPIAIGNVALAGLWILIDASGPGFYASIAH
ncbi:MAG: NADH-quinone oxidoreductase subunit H [Alphaproteobacteria bacterium]|nr:NADH-quinone oxidoreductase subunit H [Alphaproteobacteria bacterium]MCB9796373.1 NADH-quinone oxidoreductase subunit H [Alphaproteobacteria bacterium]